MRYSLRNTASRAALWHRSVQLARALPWPIIVVTIVAGALRFAQLEGVSPNAFYDAAVRSMTLSWHNFFFGAFDPSASLSIDKPPLDLWLQVASAGAGLRPRRAVDPPAGHRRHVVGRSRGARAAVSAHARSCRVEPSRS